MNTVSKDDLLSRIAEGDNAAVSEFVDRYGGLLWSMALRFSKSEADAEDAVQEVFIELWKSAKRFNPDAGSEKTFVSVIARRRLIDRLRGEKSRTETQELVEFAEPENISVDRKIELDDEAGKAVAILDQLPSEQARTIRLSIFHGLSHSQIAKTTGLSLGTVKTNIRRGLITIRNRIGATPVIHSEGGVV